MLASRWTNTSDGRIFFRTNARGPPAPEPVLLVHGLLVSGSYFIPAARRLARWTEVYLPDLPGYGRSAKPRKVLDVTELADALLRFMEACGIGRAHLVGNSFGCQVITAFAQRHPERAIRLVLQGPTVDPGARTLGRQFVRLMKNSRFERHSLGLISLRDYLRAGARRVRGSVRIAMRDRIEERLPCVRHPTLVLRGEYDPVAPQRWVEEVVRLLPDGRLMVVPGVGHAFNYSAPDAFVEAVRPFLGLGERRFVEPADGP